MKTLKVFLVAAAAVLLTAMPASAKVFRFGVKAGTEVTNMKFDKDVFSGDNRAGFTAGLMAEINIPIVGLGFDISAMYVHRVSAATGDANNLSSVLNNSNFRKRDYIEIPIHLKYKIGLPIVGNFVSPYLFTGPSFSVLASKKAIVDGYKNRAVDVAWNFGVGVELFSHLQVGASYGLGMNKTIKATGIGGINATDLDAKSNYWTITAAWLF